jgi:hypothetical protein
MLSRGKYKSLEEVGARIGRAAVAVVKAKAAELPSGTGTALDEIQSLIQRAALPSVNLLIPPFPGHIMRVARCNSLSLWDAARMIREDEPAIAFREYLWQYRKAFDPVYAADHLKRQKLKEDLERLGEAIRAAKSASGAYVRMVPINIKSSNIPWLGELLKWVGVRKVNIKMPLPRHINTYEIFMASWFE